MGPFRRWLERMLGRMEPVWEEKPVIAEIKDQTVHEWPDLENPFYPKKAKKSAKKRTKKARKKK